MPVARFSMPDGRIGRFEVPDGTTPESAQSMIEEHLNPTDSFTSRVGQDFDKRAAMSQTAADAYQSGQQSLPETALQITGKGVAGMANDVVGEGFKSGLNALDSITPNSIANPVKQGAKDVFNYVADSPVGDVARSAIQKYGNFAQNNPRAARNIDAVADIGSYVGALTPIKGQSAIGTALDTPKTAINGVKNIAASGLEQVPVLDNALGKTVRPSVNELKTISQNNYAKAAQVGGILDKQVTNDLIDHAQSFGPKDSMASSISGENPISKFASELDQFRDEPMTLERATAVDQALTERLDDPKFTDKNGVLNNYGRQLLEVKNRLRDNLSTAADKGLVQGGSEGINAYKTAVKDWSAQSQISDIQRIVDRASYMDNPATALKTGFRNIAVNPGRLSKFSPDVQKAIKHAARDGDLANILRTNLGSRLLSTMTGAIAGSAGGPVGVAIGGAMGAAGSGLARNAAEGMQMGRVNKVIDAIARKSSVPTKTIPLSERLKPKPFSLGSSVTQELPKPQEIKLLPAPENKLISDSKGVIRSQTNAERDAAILGQQNYNNLGITPDISDTISKRNSQINEMMKSSDWDKLESFQKQKIIDDINKAYSVNKSNLPEEILKAQGRAKTLARAISEQPPSTLLGDKLKNAALLSRAVRGDK